MPFQKKQINEKVETVAGSDFDIDKKQEPFNCLTNEKVIIRFVPKQKGIVTDKDHILFGGMTDNSHRSFCLRKNPNGSYVEFLTEDEQRCLEKAMGLKPGDLNPNKHDDNFFDERNKYGISRVTIGKSDTIFDLSNPTDYIKFKILMTNKAIVASSLSEMQERPLETYQFVAIMNDNENDRIASKINYKKQSWMEFGKIQESIDSMRVVLSVFERKIIPPTSKIGFLQEQVSNYVETDPKTFLKIVQDKYFKTKVLILRATDKGVIVKRGTYYYDKETNTPLCENGEDPTLTNACKYLNTIKNDNIKFSIEQKVNSDK